MRGGGHELAVVGGGPVGLAVAAGAAARGLRTVVFDQRRPPIDKACGEGIMPSGVAALERLGVRLDGAPARPFAGVRYSDRGQGAEARFRGRPGLGVRRRVLHQALAERAAAAGAELAWGVRVEGLTAAGVATSAGRHPARFVVGADGLHSRVRRWADIGLRRGPRRFGLRRHYALAPWSDLVEVHWAAGAEAYVTPIATGLVGVAVLSRRAGGMLEERLEVFPELAARLAGARAASRPRGSGPMARRPRAVVAGHVALAGDAAGYVDAISGEGLTLGFLQAEALVAAVAAGRLERYAAAHRRLSRWPFLLASGLLVAAHRPRLRRRLIRTLARNPALFASLLELQERPAPSAAAVAASAAALLAGALRA